jgi:heptosyltransferase-2
MANPDNAMVRKILVIRGGALGDFILTLPVLAALRHRFPEHSLEILGYPSVASLAVPGGLADDISPLESPGFTSFFVANGSIPKEAADWFLGFDWIISYLYDPQDIFHSNVARCSAAQFIVGPHRPDEALAVHAAEQLLRPLQALGICAPDSRPRLFLSAAPPARPRLAIHPGSGGERKNWPEAKWVELLKLLAAQTACDLLLIGGEAEGDRCARLAAALPSGRAHIAQNLPLIELARRMQGCSAFIGHDSGITHLAAALDLPGLVLWGETAMATWRPQSARMKILHDPAGLNALAVAVVWQELKSFL